MSNTPTPTAGQSADAPVPADGAHELPHFRPRPDSPLACGTPPVADGLIATDRLHEVGCLDCLMQLLIDRSVPLNAKQVSAALDRVADRHLADVLHVPAWAMPSGTAGTPLHPLSLQVRSLARRRVRMAARLLAALETRHGHTQRALHAAQGGSLPSWTLLEPGPSVETAATAEAVRMLDTVLDELAATLVLVCGQVDRWLKAQAPGVTDPVGVTAVVWRASELRDLWPLRGQAATAARIEAVDALNGAVDAYRTAAADPGLVLCAHGYWIAGGIQSCPDGCTTPVAAAGGGS